MSSIEKTELTNKMNILNYFISVKTQLIARYYIFRKFDPDRSVEKMSKWDKRTFVKMYNALDEGVWSLFYSNKYKRIIEHSENV